MESSEKTEQQTTESTTAKPSRAKTRWSNKQWFGWGLGGALVIGLCGSVAAAYAVAPTSGYTRVISRVLPLPAALVGSHTVTIKDFLSERDALVKYYTSQQQQDQIPTDADLNGQILDTLVNKAVLEEVAAKAGVQADPAQIDAALAEMVSQAGGDDALDQQLEESFGWTRDEFRSHVLHSVALSEAMQTHVSADASLQADAQTRAQSALDRLNAGEAFADVAGEVSEDFSSVNGGDVGTVPESQIPAPALEAIKELKNGAYSDIIETDGAFVILQVRDITKGEEENQYTLSSIVIGKATLAGIVEQALQNTRVTRLIDRS